MYLYKYIGIPNDPSELKYIYDFNSFIFNDDFKISLTKNYDQLFEAAGILCMSRRFDRDTWKQFISDSGICYEFVFKKPVGNTTYRRVRYSNFKNYHIKSYLFSRLKDQRIREIIDKTHALTHDEFRYFLLYKDQISKITSEHLHDEIVFTKQKTFKYENELRIVQLFRELDGIIPNPRIDLDSKLDFQSLGLILKNVYTNDTDTVSKKNNDNKISVKKLPFFV